jgi:hypothetical protein
MHQIPPLQQFAKRFAPATPLSIPVMRQLLGLSRWLTASAPWLDFSTCLVRILLDATSVLGGNHGS